MRNSTFGISFNGYLEVPHTPVTFINDFENEGGLKERALSTNIRQKV